MLKSFQKLASIVQAMDPDVVMVVGKDLYAQKGYVDLAKPYIRLSGEGGCDNGTRPKGKDRPRKQSAAFVRLGLDIELTRVKLSPTRVPMVDLDARYTALL